MFERVLCPSCGKLLFEVSHEKSGTIRIKCRGCKQLCLFSWQPTPYQVTTSDTTIQAKSA